MGSLGVVLLDAQSGKELAHFGNSNTSLWFNWSPDGRRLVTSSNTAQIWDIKTQQPLVTYQPQSAPGSISPSANPEMRLSGGNMVYASAWSPDSKLIASAIDGNAYGYNVQVWDASTGDNIRTLQIKPDTSAAGYINDVAWSPDGKYLAASSPRDGVFIWDTSTWQMLHSWSGSELAWSPTGDLIATVASDGSSIEIWNASTGQMQYSFQGQANGQRVSTLAWSPNGRYIATGGLDVRIWDTDARTLFYTYTGHGNSPNLVIRSLAWSPDSTRVASLGTGMNVIAAHIGQPFGAVKVWIAA